MEKELAGGLIAGKEEAKYKVEFKEGKLVADVSYSDHGLSGVVQLSLDAEFVLLALKKAIPGSIDDVVLDAAIKLLKGE